MRLNCKCKYKSLQSLEFLYNFTIVYRNVKHELASLSTQLAQLGQGKRLVSGGANRRLDSAKRQKENKVIKHLQ